LIELERLGALEETLSHTFAGLARNRRINESVSRMIVNEISSTFEQAIAKAKSSNIPTRVALRNMVTDDAGEFRRSDRETGLACIDARSIESVVE
jgi:hypothetical protein